MMKTKIAFTAAAVLIAALLITGGTLAWFTDEKTATNVVTTGNVKIALHDSASTISEAPVSNFETVTGIVPGEQIPKYVTVKNTGNNAAFVRVQIVPTWYKTVDGADVALTAQELSDAGIVNGGVTYTVNDTNWTDRDANGYYIYEGTLASGETAPMLLSKVTVDTAVNDNLNNAAAGYKLKIAVKAEATQSANRGTATYATVWG